MAEALQQLGDEAAGRHADVAAPMDQPLGRPFLVRPVRGRHVFVQRREPASAGATGMARHAFAAVEDLHQSVGDACLQLQPHQRVRHAVAMALDLDVVIDVRRDGLEGRPLPALRRQRRQRGRVEGGEEARAAAVELLEPALVERRQQRSERSVGGVYIGQHGVPQPCHQPPLDDLHRRLGAGLVLR